MLFYKKFNFAYYFFFFLITSLHFSILGIKYKIVIIENKTYLIQNIISISFKILLNTKMKFIMLEK